jgi:hypothetical protein
MNEIETRRVRNALGHVADAAPALSPEELAALAARSRSARISAGRRSRPRRVVVAVPVAAVLAVGVGAGAIARDEGERRSETTAGPTLVTFPEGSAVHLLTATAERDGGR